MQRQWKVTFRLVTDDEKEMEAAKESVRNHLTFALRRMVATPYLMWWVGEDIKLTLEKEEAQWDC
jgi:hypothetical protein